MLMHFWSATKKLCFAGVLTCLSLWAHDSVGYGAPIGNAPPLIVTTYGTSLTSGGGWQAPLQRRLMDCASRPVIVHNRARAGASSRWGLQNIERVNHDRPDVVLIEFSINDAALNRMITPGESRANMRGMVERLRRQNPGVRIYFQAMSDGWGLRRWMRPMLDAYASDHRRLAAALGVGFVDHRPYWKSVSKRTRREIMPDGLHPLPQRSAELTSARISEVVCRGLEGP
ncbi:SGNH/GDSL hydrolase family protein [Pseudomonas sp. ODNR1LW]|nr:SGNH/GDSL hydrolase family protein [Pseudomonas sp. ODNR1LW]